ERVTTALEKSINFAQKHQQKVRAILTTYAKTQWNVRTFFVLPTYTTEFSRPALDKLSDSAVKYLVIKEQPDLDAILPYPRGSVAAPGEAQPSLELRP